MEELQIHTGRMPDGLDTGGASRFPLPAVLAVFVAAFGVLAWPWLSGAVTIPWDAKAQFHPQLQFLAASLATGESPAWAPHVFGGWPQIADPQSLIFSPPHFLLALIDPAPSFRAADAVVFAMLFLGGVGVILFFRDRGWHAAGALVAALAFAFGGSAASRIQHIGQIMSLAYLPLALWLLARALERASWMAGTAAGIAVGLLAIGRDQVALLGLYLLAGFVVAHWMTGERITTRIKASLPPLLACAGVSTLVAAIPLLLTALLASDSNRPAVDFVTAGRGSLHPAHLLMLVFADLYGAADPAVDYWGPPSLSWGTAFGIVDLYHAQNIGQVYAGALPLVAILGFGLLRGWAWAREIRFFSIAFILLLLYALGRYTPAFRAIYELVPGVSLFRRPADATFVLGFVLAIIAGYLVHCWLSRAGPPLAWWQRVAGIVLAAALVALAIYLAWRIGTLAAAVPPVVTGSVLAAGAIATLATVRRLLHPAAAGLLVAFMVVDLRWNNGPNESTGLPPSTYDALRPDSQNETIALIKRRLAETSAPDRRDRVELTGLGYHWPNASLAHGFDHLFGQNPLRLREFGAATGVGDTVAVPDQRGFAPLFRSYRSTFADLFGLRVIATGVPAERIDPSLRPGDLNLLGRTKDAYVYGNPRALPRVVLVPGWQLTDFAQLIRSGWPDVDPRRVVLLDRPPAAVAPPAGAGGGTVRIARYANTEVIVEVDAPAGGFLLLNDVWHPWWRAEIDGTAAAILKANVLFRAVQVEPGRHQVLFSFHPLAGAFAQLRAKFAAAP
jgi:hypothetical protein